MLFPWNFPHILFPLKTSLHVLLEGENYLGINFQGNFKGIEIVLAGSCTYGNTEWTHGQYSDICEMWWKHKIKWRDSVPLWTKFSCLQSELKAYFKNICDWIIWGWTLWFYHENDQVNSKSQHQEWYSRIFLWCLKLSPDHSFLFWSTKITPSYNTKRYLHKLSWPYYKIGMLFSQDPPFVTLPIGIAPWKQHYSFRQELSTGSFLQFLLLWTKWLIMTHKYLGWKENPIWFMNRNTEGTTGLKLYFFSLFFMLLFLTQDPMAKPGSPPYFAHHETNPCRRVWCNLDL